jgi:hypothetical protein
MQGFDTYQSPFGGQTPFRQPEPFSQRFRRFLRTQPVLALLLAQAIALYVWLPATFFYGFLYVILLYFGGVFIRQFYSDAMLITVYLASALAGYVAFPWMFSGSLWEPGVQHLAAAQGAAVFGLLSFISLAKPDLKLRVFLLMQIRFWYIAVALMAYALLRKDIMDGGTHLNCLAGVIPAALMAAFLPGSRIAIRFQRLRSWYNRRREKRFTKFETIRNEGKPLRDEEYNDIRADRQKEVDRILDKISQSGYDSLTLTEKELLFRQSK